MSFYTDLGNGDFAHGEDMERLLAAWLTVARCKHPHVGYTEDEALVALKDEVKEVEETAPGTPAREAELWDVIVVAWRMLNEEYGGL
ncbi:MAG: hypothetical protein HDQ88_10490 [Clostridia bacterium]|nr:hypothetical protein [Clostridia bacterium]